jgi:hypothetical protein
MIPLLLALAVQADTLIPRSVAQDIRVVGDTVWFIPDLTPLRAAPIPVIGYARRTGQWIVGVRPRRSFREPVVDNPRAGQLGLGEPIDTLRLAYGYALVDTTPQPDPRGAGKEEQASTHRYAIVRGNRPVDEVRIRVSGAERRRVYLAAGNKLGPSEVPPPFTTAVSIWTAGDGVIAFSFDAPDPAGEDEMVHSMRTTGEEATWAHYLTGLLLFDTATKKSVSLVHPALIENKFLALEVAGGAVWAMPTDDDHRAEQPDTVAHLVRYDLVTKTWRVFDDRNLPLSGAYRMRGDGDRLYVVGSDGVGVLDARTQRWETRYFRAATIALRNGEDSAVTRISSRPIPRILPDVAELRYDTVDTAVVFDLLVDELRIKSRRAFGRELVRRVAIDTLHSLMWENRLGRGSNRYETESAWSTPEVHEAFETLLADPVFIPFLREAAESEWSRHFAYHMLRAHGDAELLRMWRHAMEHGDIPVALEAADSLRARGDSSAVSWLRARLMDPHFVEIGEQQQPYSIGERPVDGAIMRLSGWGDRAFAARAIELLEAPVARTSLDYRSNIIEALLRHPEATVRQRAVARLEGMPDMWLHLLLFASDSVFGADPAVRAGNLRILTRLLNSSRAFTDSLGLRWPPSQRRAFARDNVMSRAMTAIWHVDRRAAVQLLIETFVNDPEDAIAKGQALVLMTANDAAPAQLRREDTVERMVATQAYWRAWWRQHGATFRPATSDEGNAALKRWWSKTR